MMKRFLIALISIGLLASVQAQNQKVREPHADYDDDGGRVFLLRQSSDSIEGYRYHGGAIISTARQVNIFLGSAWEKNREQEVGFADLLNSLNDKTETMSLSQFHAQGSQTLSHEEIVRFPKSAKLSDLDVQARLVDTFKANPSLGPDTNTVYMVFLAPGIGSTVGGAIGGKHYLAYHNYFNTAGVEVHYAVIPYEENQEVAHSIAKRALLETIINPTGGGWY
jgi:hypothetical protein